MKLPSIEQLSQTIQQQVSDPILLLKIENMLNRQVNAQIPSIYLQERIENRVRYSLEDMMEHVAQTIITELNSPGMPIGFRPWVGYLTGALIKP